MVGAGLRARATTTRVGPASSGSLLPGRVGGRRGLDRRSRIVVTGSPQFEDANEQLRHAQEQLKQAKVQVVQAQSRQTHEEVRSTKQQVALAAEQVQLAGQRLEQAEEQARPVGQRSSQATALAAWAERHVLETEALVRGGDEQTAEAAWQRASDRALDVDSEGPQRIRNAKLQFETKPTESDDRTEALRHDFWLVFVERAHQQAEEATQRAEEARMQADERRNAVTEAARVLSAAKASAQTAKEIAAPPERILPFPSLFLANSRTRRLGCAQSLLHRRDLPFE